MREKGTITGVMEIWIYTDGSCIGNPGPGGWAAILLRGNDEVILKGAEQDTTNNRMEMMAIIKALDYLRNKSKIKDEELQEAKIKIHSDSNLVIQTFKQNWKRKKNLDLWEQLDKLRAWLDIEWIWVKGHSDDAYNNKADQLANEQARKISK